MNDESSARRRMSRFGAMFRAAACAMALAACGGGHDGTIAELVDSGAGPIQLRLKNSGSVALTNVSVLVADDVAPITTDILLPGPTLSFVSRASAHTGPVVSAKVGGQTLSSLPVEGFSGFNPLLTDGRYTVGLEAAVLEGSLRLIVKVVREQ